MDDQIYDLGHVACDLKWRQVAIWGIITFFPEMQQLSILEIFIVWCHIASGRGALDVVVHFAGVIKHGIVRHDRMSLTNIFYWSLRLCNEISCIQYFIMDPRNVGKERLGVCMLGLM